MPFNAMRVADGWRSATIHAIFGKLGVALCGTWSTDLERAKKLLIDTSQQLTPVVDY
jgi:hypothetical protein